MPKRSTEATKDAEEVSGLEHRRRIAEKSANESYSRRSREVIDAAARLFAEKGYETSTLADVAKTVGMDRATLYYYFKSKADLLETAIADIVDAGIVDFRNISTSDADPPEKLRAIIHRLVTVFETEHPYSQLYLQDNIVRSSDFGPDWARDVVRSERLIEKAVRDVVVEGQASGDFRDDVEPELLAKLILSVNWTYRWFRPGRGRSAEEIADAFCLVLTTGILSNEARAGFSSG